MRRVPLAVAFLAAIGLAALAAMPAAAATSVSVGMTFTEPLKAGWPGSEPCPDIGIDFNCGSGEVIPFGHATQIVSIGACGATCSFRWIDLADGSIVLRETAGDFTCPGGVRDRMAARSTLSRDAYGCRRRWNRHLRGRKRQPDRNAERRGLACPDQVRRDAHAGLRRRARTGRPQIDRCGRLERAVAIRLPSRSWLGTAAAQSLPPPAELPAVRAWIARGFRGLLSARRCDRTISMRRSVRARVVSHHALVGVDRALC